MGSMSRVPHIHSSCCSSPGLDQLTLPRYPARDLTIVGGGLSGLLVAKSAAEHIESFKKALGPLAGESAESRDGNIQSLSLLVGGDSLAYAPVRGEFSELLTLHGSDDHPRVRGLDLLRDIVAERLSKLSFNFDLHTRATKVSLGSGGRFRVDACRAGTPICFESDKLVLALGHTIREVAPELTRYVIRGGGELCKMLSSALPVVAQKEECLDRVLRNYNRVDGETLRIGLIGLGPSMFEVLKVLDAFLYRSEGAPQTYRLKGSGTPIELVLYEPHLAGHSTTHQGLLSLLRDRLVKPPESMVPDSVRHSNRKIAERFIKLSASGQLTLVPERFDWDSLKLNEGFLVSPKSCSACAPQQLSLVIDCAPFEEGIGEEQHALIQELDMVELQQVKGKLWRVKEVHPAWQKRLAFAGAAVLPRWRWNAIQMESDAHQIIERFYGKSASPTE